MSVFRTRRPLLVDATQCAVPTTITTDTGFRHVESGDWIIHGEDGETYVVDDTYFQRTYVAVDDSWTDVHTAVLEPEQEHCPC
ncbi:MAG TPA: hypothetical protein VGD59_12980 [Acidisarcina sp.]